MSYQVMSYEVMSYEVMSCHCTGAMEASKRYHAQAAKSTDTQSSQRLKPFASRQVT